MEPSDSEVDFGLLRGFRFRCRPDCGLCCYASAAVTRPERTALLAIAPELPLPLDRDGLAHLPTRSEGGACALLEVNRCRAHAVRPFPCRAFPIHTHLGSRAQSSLVLGCPGVGLEALEEWTPSAAAGLSGPEGLDPEIAAVRGEAEPALVRGLISGTQKSFGRLRRRLSREGRWEEPGALLAELGRAVSRLPESLGAGLPPPDGPELEELPLFFDERHGRVLIRSTPAGGYELLAARESGGLSARLGEFTPPARAPALEARARSLLEGYLRYLASREQFLWSAYHELSSGGSESLRDRLRANLIEARDEVLRRASVIARLGGETGETLDPGSLARGVRATDAELLDRPTLGRVL